MWQDQRHEVYVAECCGNCRPPVKESRHSYVRAHAIVSNAVILLLAAAGSTLVAAENPPMPPCAGEAFPTIPSVEASPIVKAWGRSDLPQTWSPPACTGWKNSDFTSMVVIAGRFRFAMGAEELRRRIGAISETAGIRYWSTTQKKWRTLILQAHALQTAGQDRPRSDFALAEIAAGQTLFFTQEDNTFGRVTYRLRIRSAGADHISYEVENVSTIRYLLAAVLQPGDLQSIYFLDSDSADIWRYYAITRAGGRMGLFLKGSHASAVNRAIALYRHIAGIPTDQEPPAAR
jgi:hypothetical protein